MPCNPGLVMYSYNDLFCLQASLSELAKYYNHFGCCTAIDPQAIEADYLWPLQVFNLLLLLTNHSVCLPQGWLCSMLRDDGPLQQQNVCCEGDSTEQGVQTAPEGQGTQSCSFRSRRVSQRIPISGYCVFGIEMCTRINGQIISNR